MKSNVVKTFRPRSNTAERILDFIVSYKRAHDGNSPTVDEIGQGVGLTSKNTVWVHLRNLELANKIERGHGSRMISVIGGAWTLQA